MWSSLPRDHGIFSDRDSTASSSSEDESASEETSESSSEEQGPVVVPCAGVIITEVMYDPTTSQGSDTTGEWVEILNYSCESVDLAGWQIQDNFATDPLQPLDGGINNIWYSGPDSMQSLSTARILKYLIYL